MKISNYFVFKFKWAINWIYLIYYWHLQLTVFEFPTHTGNWGALHEWEIAKVPPIFLGAHLQDPMWVLTQTIFKLGEQANAAIKENKVKIINSTKVCFIIKIIFR